MQMPFLQQSNASSEKKCALEGLDRDELVRRYKGLLKLAQQAKKTKDGKLLN